MRKAFFFFMIIVFSVFFGALASAEIITKNITFRWGESSGNPTGYRIYCGNTPGGSYSGVQITEGNPADIPVSSLADSENPEATLEITMDTTTHNMYCVATAYNADGESGNSNEQCSTTALMEGTFSDETLDLTIHDEVSFENSNFQMRQSLSSNYDFGEDVVIGVGHFSMPYKEFVAVGKTSGTVWVIPTSSSGPEGNYLSRQTWLSDVDMDNIDAVVAINFNHDISPNATDGDDIAVIDYLNGRLKIFLNTGSAFNSTPVGDYHATKGNLGEFTSGAFQWAAAGDFTGNGCEDLALYAPGTRNVVVWQSNCSAIVDRSVWAQGGSASAKIYAIDYNGDEKRDIMFFNFAGGAFSAFASTGSAFQWECVRLFTANAFDYAVAGNFIPWNTGKKEEFGIHSRDATGNFVVFEYAPAYSGDSDPFKSRAVWINTSNQLH